MLRFLTIVIVIVVIVPIVVSGRFLWIRRDVADIIMAIQNGMVEILNMVETVLMIQGSIAVSRVVIIVVDVIEEVGVVVVVIIVVSVAVCGCSGGVIVAIIVVVIVLVIEELILNWLESCSIVVIIIH